MVSLGVSREGSFCLRLLCMWNTHREMERSVSRSFAASQDSNCLFTILAVKYFFDSMLGMFQDKKKKKTTKRKWKGKKKSPLSFKQVYKAPKSFTQVIFHLELLDWVHGWPPKGSTFLLLSLIVSSLFLYSSLICPITMISFNKYLLSTYYVPGNTLAYSGYIGEQKFLFSVEFTF